MLTIENRGPEFAAARPTLAVIGIGAIEQHSHHLAVSTDWVAVAEVSRRVAQELDAWLLPAIPFSMSECHGSMDGTVWIKPETLAAVLRDVARSVRSQGVKRLLILNGHGGNFVLEPCIQALNWEFPDLLTIMPAEVWAGAEGGKPIFESAGQEIHAGEAETSTQLYLNGETVKPPRHDCVPPVGREFLDYAFMDLISPDGAWGRPSLGDRDKGERAIRSQVTNIVRWVRVAFEELG